jgi:hypothetical protein
MQGSPSVRKIEGFLRAELKATQEVLALQQKDNYHFQDHVKLLSGEVDALHIMVEEQQQVINKLKQDITTRDDIISELKNEVRDNKIEKHAFKTFELQNILLLEELKETKRKMEELEIEVRFMRDLKHDKEFYDEEKMKMVAEMDIKLNGHLYDYPYDSQLPTETENHIANMS